VYLESDGGPVRRPAGLRRIKELAIPPAWTDVWICADPRGHLQATGRDARGRKQYLYEARWTEARDETKYGRMIEFGRALPRLRRRVKRDLSLSGLPREKIVAAVVWLLDSSNIRVGNVEYARDNQSFGLTTMRERHVSVRGEHVRFRFKGKSGREHDVDIHDRRLVGIVRRCQDLPGQQLFQYLDDDGEPRTVESDDVNEYLRRVTGEEFTAKDFRTWSGTVLAAIELARLGAAESETDANQKLAATVRSVAVELGNTPAVCRRCYVHPAIVEGYLAGRVIAACRDERSCEKAVLELLRKESRPKSA
jgi:DNA topoisomerase-1